MTDSNYTHLLVVVDRSGSMRPVKDDMVGALDSFFEEQAKLEGTCLVDYFQFDDTNQLVFWDMPVAKAKAVLQPRGMTALLDAIGQSVTTMGAKFAAMDERDRPGNVVVAVVTDGFENASREWTSDAVRELIKEQEDKYNWNFTFLGANMDAPTVGAGLGFNPDTSLTYTTGNTVAMSAAMSGSVTRSRLGQSPAYTEAERAAQK